MGVEGQCLEAGSPWIPPALRQYTQVDLGERTVHVGDMTTHHELTAQDPYPEVVKEIVQQWRHHRRITMNYFAAAPKVGLVVDALMCRKRR